ncbi:hypothetical protein AAF712_005610 [Marasmius tenuissimus]|uniref:Protein kinase domain-containing protein n=1 Tax=Marasmius tenuissimus TaxID=585030 RepID=A0ABR3A202_9AGAR|nr:hypothetical protein PM082_000200 [Marasmius tenuissimus]
MSCPPTSPDVTPPTAPTDSNDKYLENNFRGGLSESEVFWRDRQKWLEKQGYMLRPRFRPGWVPSWKDSSAVSMKFEDGASFLHTPAMIDATRISDGEIVVLKKVQLWEPSQGEQPELKMGPLFRTEPYTSDPRNNCVPIYDTLSLPKEDNMKLLVMPFLRSWEEPLFETVGEALDFCRQTFQGLQFMHEHHIAHNDIKVNNILADTRPLYDAPLHPASYTRSYDWKSSPSPRSRTRRPIKYYFIDFDMCEQYDPSTGPPQKVPGYGGDQTVPEFARDPGKPCNPFAVDVYRMGNVVREGITGGTPGTLGKQKLDPTFKFLHPLIADMTHDDPAKRPTMDEVALRFDTIVKGLSGFKLRSRISTTPANAIEKPRFPPAHWARQLYNFITRVPAIPTPRPEPSKK